MKYLLNFINKHKDYLIVAFLSFLLSLPYITDICSGYLNYYYFDLQEFLLWHYAAINNIIPYKEIFYPYGLLNYFRNYNLTFTFAYYLIPTLLFTITFLLFKKIFKDKFILYFSIIILYVFVLTLAGFQTFSRYGLLVVFSLLFSYLFYSGRRLAKRYLICCGIILGSFISFVNDQGIYLLISFIFIFLLNKCLYVKKRCLPLSIFSRDVIGEFIFVIVGLLMGMIPLLILYNGDFSFYFSYLNNVGQLFVVGKSPFFSFIDSPANIFTISILYFAIFYNFLKLFFFKHKLTLSSFFQMSLILSILIMEQKSISRSIDKQITFVSLMLLMFMVYELVNIFKNESKNKKIIYIIVLISAVVVYGFNIERPATNFSSLSNSYNLLINNKCFDSNLKFFSRRESSYLKIMNFLKMQQGFNGRVFSFPTGDSALYILLNQKPPYYNAIFEGASYENQNLTIKYIQSNEIEYVTLNTSKFSLQDAVPDYIRQGILFKYILNNYEPFTVIGDHIILRKDRGNDFFASESLKQTKGYINYLLSVYLYKIPFSEGLYKYKYLEKNNKLIVENNNASAINNFLKNHILYSSNKVFALIPNTNRKQQGLSFLKFQIENGNTTTIYYDSCRKNETCVINLSRIPIFYKDRIIAKITLDKEFNGVIKIFDLRDSGNLW